MISQEVNELLQKGAIQETPYTRDSFYSRLFLVPKKEGSMCPVIDLSSLNKFIVNKHFQMENLSCLKTLLLPGDFMTYRFKRRLSFCPGSQVFPKVPSLHLEGNMLPVQSSSIRPLFGPQNF